ncbi:ferric citrate ABC transporter ATP-binding protein FecE [Clostridia bacterium]|nr:ferric citrate ABC transporter ATP-binding protein FecE [Clostridia bacterium]
MLELSHLCGGYGGIAAVSDVSLSFPKGRFTVIVGSNGCGKTTLLKLSCGQLRPVGGTVTLGGRVLSSMKGKEIAQKISYLPQSRPIPDTTVETLVLHGRFPYLGYPRVYQGNDLRIARQAMEKVGIAAHKNKLASKLSGGERQKAYLAMLLAQDTEVMLLDEPTTYLDIGCQLDLLELLSELGRVGKTVIAVLHDLNQALRYADNIVVMRGGRVTAEGLPSSVLDALEQAFGVTAKLEERYEFSVK